MSRNFRKISNWCAVTQVTTNAPSLRELSTYVEIRGTPARPSEAFALGGAGGSRVEKYWQWWRSREASSLKPVFSILMTTFPSGYQNSDERLKVSSFEGGGVGSTSSSWTGALITSVLTRLLGDDV